MDKERFHRQFQLSVANLQDRIGQLGSIAAIAGERQDATDSILAGISRLSQEVADVSEHIPAYDQRIYSETVKSLTDALNAEVARSAPKGRFQFKRTARTATSSSSAAQQNDPRVLRNATPATATVSTATAGAAPGTPDETSDAVGVLPTFPPPKNYNAELAAQPSTRSSSKGAPDAAGSGASVRKPSFSMAREVAISGHTGLHIVLPLTASRATASGSLTDLTGCVVDMSLPTASRSHGENSDDSEGSDSNAMAAESGSAFLSLVLKSIRRSLIVAGHVNGSVHITGIRDAVLVVAARQVRIHECHNVDLYLYCTGRPIIEDCSDMRFAPLPQTYTSQHDDPTKNQWDQVDDFKWLKADHSPNWSVLPEAARLPETVWTGPVAGIPGLGTEDVLKAVGLGKKPGVSAQPQPQTLE